MAESFYPLYLHDLTQAEKKLLVEIFLAATTSTKKKRSRLSVASRRSLMTVKALEDQARKDLNLDKGESFSLRSLLSGEFAAGRQLDVPYQKWVFLYNYAMGGFREVCKAHDDKALLVMIDNLHKLSKKSGRYDRDVHLLNAEYLNFRSWEKKADARLSNGPYIGFRYSSTLENKVVSVLNIRNEDGRLVFTCHALRGTEERESRGYVYEPRAQVHLFGLLGDDFHAEFYSLIVDDPNADVLHGIISTISSTGQLHAKQCFFVRMGTIKKLEDMAKTFQTDKSGQPTKGALQRLGNAVEQIFEGEAIRRTNARLLPLSRYLNSEFNLKPKDAGEATAKAQ